VAAHLFETQRGHASECQSIRHLVLAETRQRHGVETVDIETRFYETSAGF